MLADTMDANNPNLQCEEYLREKVSKLQGILQAFIERKSYIRTYATRCELRKMKTDKL